MNNLPARLLAVLLLTGLLSGLLASCSSQTDPQQRLISFHQGEFLLKNQPQPPAFDNHWQAITLPDLWDYERPKAGGTGWYRFALKLNVPPNRLWGIYLPRLNRNVAVFINGALIGQNAPWGNTRTTSWNHPQYFNIPNGILRSGSNEILIRLTAEPHHRGRLLPFFTGPDSLLRPIYQQSYFWRITLTQVIAAFALTMGLSIGVIWLVRREADYGWFALGSLFWAGFTLWFFIKTAPMDIGLWMIVTNISGICMISSMWIFVGKHAAIDSRKTNQAIIGYCLVVAITLPLLPKSLQFDGLVVAYMLLFIPNLWLFSRFIKNWYHKRSVDNAIIFISILPIIILGTHDWLNLAFHLQQAYLLHYSAPFIFVLMGWALLRRFIQAINQSEKLKQELEVRVQQREDELKKAFETIHELEKKKALEQERERIMRDIHDGVGGQLVSALAILEHDRRQSPLLSDSLNLALDDLRLVIDTLAPDDATLDQQLGMFKYRYEPKLRQYGIELQWQLRCDVSVANFSPQQTLQLLRMIQEIFTNILKHAQASEIQVNIEHQNDRIAITIRDNGIGFSELENIRGRGIGNLKKRAAESGLEITFGNHSGGACVQILIPVCTTE